MPTPQAANGDLAQRAGALYERELREKLEPLYNGRLLVVDVDSGDYELADRVVAPAVHRLKARRPDASVFLLRVGHRTAFRVGYRQRGQSS